MNETRTFLTSATTDLLKLRSYGGQKARSCASEAGKGSSWE